MKNSRVILVSVSTLALSAAYGLPAHAQLQISCAQNFFVGEHDACSTGTLVIDPDGSTTLSGCLVTENPPNAAQCKLSTAGPGPTRDVTVQFKTSAVFITAGGSQAKVVSFRMSPVGTTVTGAKFTFTPTQVTNTVTLDVGGTLQFSAGQAIGVYTGTVSIVADLI